MKNIFKFCNVAFGMCNRFSLTVSPQKLLKWLKEREVNNEDIESAKNATVMSIPVEKIMAIQWTVMRLKINKNGCNGRIWLKIHSIPPRDNTNDQNVTC